MARKFYVVWVGRQTGIFTDWDVARTLVHEFPGARFKSFETQEEAEHAFKAGRPPAVGRLSAATKKSAKKVPAKADEATFDLQIYCDGACEPNPGNAGSGIAVYRSGIVAQLWYGLYHPNGTNNTAELNALHHALMMAGQAILANERPQILSDSMYAINCVTVWAQGWEKRGWRKASGEIKNLEIIQSAYALYSEIEAQVQLTHINAHIGTEGNELADRMAMFAVHSKEKELRLYEEAIDVPALLRMQSG